MVRKLYGICLLVLICSAVFAETIENKLLRVELKGQDLSITSKVTGSVSVPKLNLAYKIAKSKVESNALKLVHENGWTTKLYLPESSPFLHVDLTIANKTDKPAVYGSFDILTLEADCGAPTDTLNAVGTGGVKPVANAKGSYSFGVIADPDTRRSVVCAYLTQEQGIGLCFPEVVAGKPRIKARIEFGRLRVNPGATRRTETLLVGCFEDGRIGLESFADAVAEKYKIKLPERPHVYCTWYVNKASDEKTIAATTAFLAKHIKPFGLNVIQIDDNWQTTVPAGAPYEDHVKKTGSSKCFVSANANYPSGMAHTAKNITSHGFVAGLWFMPWAANYKNPFFDEAIFAKYEDGTPFHTRWSGTCIDSTNPKGEAFIRERVKRIYDWGYRYLKIDGMHTGLATHNIYVNQSFPTDADRESMAQRYAKFIKDGNEKAAAKIGPQLEDCDGYPKLRLHNPDMTQVQAYRKCLKIVQEEAPEAMVLGCNVSQNMRCMGPAFGLIPAMRIGPDNGGAANGSWGHTITGAWHGSNLYFLNGRIWYNDTDPAYVRKSVPLESARWMVSWVAMSGGMQTSSERYDTLSAERLDLLKRCLPGHDCVVRPVDYLETDKPRIWLAENDTRHVVGLFNWNEKSSEEIIYDMGKLGLDKGTAYVGFDFWSDKFVDSFSGQLNQTLDPGTCRIIALKPEADYPQLLSTSRHITQGLIDVLDEKWDPDTKTLSGKSKVLAGDIYELRIALPSKKGMKPTSAELGGKPMKIGTVKDGGVRIAITPKESKTVDWTVSF